MKIFIEKAGKYFIGKACRVSFSYNTGIINYVKSFPVRRWIPETKEWEFPHSKMRDFIEFYKKARPAESIFVEDHTVEKKQYVPIPFSYQYKAKPYDHQIKGIEFGLNHDNFLLADEQGCVDEDTVIKIRSHGATRALTIKQAYNRFQNVKKGKASDFMIRCLKDDYFGPYPFTDIVYSGYKDCLKMTLKSGKFLIATPDHEVLTNRGYIALQQLKTGDIVLTNGMEKCKRCGSSDNVITYEYAKFKGYCKRCMYKYLRDCYTYNGIKRKIIKGYYYLRGEQLRGSHLNTVQGVPEHQYIAEQKYGRKIDLSCEVVHHIDHNPLNNNPDNLVIMSRHEHNMLHSQENFKHLYRHNYVSKGSEMVVVPKEDIIVSIEPCGKRNVYDIKMKDPYRNFVANGIVVHNCGKTYQTINIAIIRKMLYNYKHCLIVCAVNGSKYNWKKECELYSDEKAHILGTRKNSKGEERVKGNTEKLEDLKNIDSLPYFIITNKESLRDEEIKNKLKNMADMCIIDEIHLAKNHRSQEGKGILSIKARSKIAISGTPILNNPIDTYFTMKFLGQETHSMTIFKSHYCIMGGYGGYEVVGYKNLKELQDRFGSIQIRRLKKDCLSLPDKTETVEYVELTGKQDVIYRDVLNALRADLDKISLSLNPLTQLIRLRQATGNPNLLSSNATESIKYDRVCEIVEELAQNGRKCLVFSNWVEMLKPLYERLKKHNPALIIGETKDIEAEKYKLNNNPTCHVCLGTIGAMGTSHTLTGADTVIFLDEPWNRGTKEQAIDRCHRIGTKNNVTIITLIAKNTIDEKIHNIILQKGAYADLIVDGKISYNKKQMLSYLLDLEENQ